MPDKNDVTNDVEDKPRGKHARVSSDAIPAIDIAEEDENEGAFAAQETSVLQPGEMERDLSSVDNDATQAFVPVQGGVDQQTAQYPGMAQQYAGAQFGMSGASVIDMPKDRSKTKKIVAIVIGIIVGALLVIYLAGVAVFSDRFYPNTKMGDLDLSLQSTADVRSSINKRVGNYSLTITGPNGFSQKVTASEVGLVCDETITLDDLSPNRNIWAWPVEIFKSHSLMDNMDASYNLALVQSVVGGAVDAFNTTAVQPTNASLVFNTTKNSYEVKSEVSGTALDKDVVVSEAIKAMASLQSTLTLDSSCLKKPAVLSTDTRLSNAVATANKMIQANLTYTLDNVAVAQLTPATISGWVVIDDNCNATLNNEMLSAWIEQTAQSLNTVGSKRTYTRPDGKVITVEGGAYGWEIDNDAFAEQVIADVKEGGTKTSAIECTMVGEGFTAVGGADWGKRYIDVDLSEQYVRFYDSTGNLIWEADCISGAPTEGHATPQGVWYVVTKESPSKLIGYAEDGETKEYETTVQYWMPFEGNGVGFHDATWQPSFGGTLYAEGYGSHGCINLSYSDAESLYSIIQPNDVVVVHE